MIDSTKRALAVTILLTVIFVAPDLAMDGLDQDNIWRDVGLLGLNTLPLLALHRAPLAVLLTFGGAYPLWLGAGHEAYMFQSLPTLVALYAVGTWNKPLWLRAIGLVAPVWMLSVVLIGWWWNADLLEIGYIALIFVLAWGLGVIVAARQSYVQQLEAKTEALEAARRELADRAVADERSRIARELHDVIAHAMSVITVRAGVGAHLVDSRPAEAAEALGVIERTGRQALSEMRRMLTVLRNPDPQASQEEPQPGLAELPRLVEQVAKAGVAATVTSEGTAEPLSPGLDLAAYRVVQEALTNVAKHAPGSRASVTIRHLADTLEIEVANAAETVGPIVPGQGIVGMTERAELYGGKVVAEPYERGFRVSAWFPRESADGVR